MNHQNKAQSFKYGLIASLVILGLNACQSSNTDAVKADQQQSQQTLEHDKRQVKERKKADAKAVAQKQERAVVANFRADRSGAGRQAYPSPSLAMSYPSEPVNREQYQDIEPSDIHSTLEEPVSTFSIDVDTGSYSNVRRMLNDGYMPPSDAVRLEEFVNYFNYDYPAPESQDMPFSVSTEVMNAPWNKNAQLVQIGVQGYEEQHQQLPPSNLVFLVDVSGSMRSDDKLGLVKKALTMLAKGSRQQDTISLVVYAGASGVVLEPTAANDRVKIEQALSGLTAGGSTNGGAGIDLAYKMAEQAFIKDGINRVILATDGDFNVGTINREQLIDMIERKRKTGISFSALGFGRGNYNEHLMEQLADKGNGNYGYIDNLREAKKLLVDQRAGTLLTIAKDVKIQVEFNPEVVSEYRLLGYQNRMLEREDFNNDKVDAGEIGAGHNVTALYEIVLQDSDGQRLEPLRYAQKKAKTNGELGSEAAMISLRYKLPDSNTSKLHRQYLKTSDVKTARGGDNIRFAASVAGFAELLRGGQFLGDWGWDEVKHLAQQAKGDDLEGYRGELIQLVGLAKVLDDSSAAGSQ